MYLDYMDGMNSSKVKNGQHLKELFNNTNKNITNYLNDRK
jgi:hypothetical protein